MPDVWDLRRVLNDLLSRVGSGRRGGGSGMGAPERCRRGGAGGRPGAVRGLQSSQQRGVQQPGRLLQGAEEVAGQGGRAKGALQAAGGKGWGWGGPRGRCSGRCRAGGRGEEPHSARAAGAGSGPGRAGVLAKLLEKLVVVGEAGAGGGGGHAGGGRTRRCSPRRRRCTVTAARPREQEEETGLSPAAPRDFTGESEGGRDTPAPARPPRPQPYL